MNLALHLTTLDQLETDAIVVGVALDNPPLSGILGLLDWRLCGMLTKLRLQQEWTAEAGESLLIATSGRLKAPRLFLFGWGEKRSFLEESLFRLHQMTSVLEKAGVTSCAVATPDYSLEAYRAAKHFKNLNLPFQLTGIFEPELDPDPFRINA